MCAKLLTYRNLVGAERAGKQTRLMLGLLPGELRCPLWGMILIVLLVFPWRLPCTAVRRIAPLRRWHVVPASDFCRQGVCSVNLFSAWGASGSAAAHRAAWPAITAHWEPSSSFDARQRGVISDIWLAHGKRSCQGRGAIYLIHSIVQQRSASHSAPTTRSLDGDIEQVVRSPGSSSRGLRTTGDGWFKCGVVRQSGWPCSPPAAAAVPPP